MISQLVFQLNMTANHPLLFRVDSPDPPISLELHFVQHSSQVPGWRRGSKKLTDDLARKKSNPGAFLLNGGIAF